MKFTHILATIKILGCFIVALAVISTASAGHAVEFEASRESDHFIIFYHAEYEQRADTLLSAHENSYTFVTEWIGYKPHSKIEIYLCSTPEEYVEVLNAPPEARPPVGAQAGTYSNGVLSYYNIFGGEPCVTHELVHAVETQLLQFERPCWWVEGLACYVAHKFAGAPGPGGLYPNQLSDFTSSIFENDPPFKTLSELEGEIVITKFVYEESTSVFLFIDEKYGESKVKEIIQAADTVENVREAFQAVFGIGFQAFEAEWRNCLTQSVVAIAEARTAVSTAERDGRTQGLDEAKARLSDAESSFNGGRFGTAWAMAEKAKELAESAVKGAPTITPGAPTITPLLVGAGIALLAGITVFGLALRRRKRVQRSRPKHFDKFK